jgi:hypothetical protein
MEDTRSEVSKDDTRDKGHAVGEVETNDGQVEDGVDGYGIHEHEKSLSQSANGTEGYGANWSFVGRENAEVGGARETVIYDP